MKFIKGQTRKSNKSIMLVRFLSLPHGFKLLESNIHDHDAFRTNELVRLGATWDANHYNFSIGS